MQCFCSDLLDLRKLTDGEFALISEPFNPAETLDLVRNIFSPQASAKQVQIICKLCDSNGLQ